MSYVVLVLLSLLWLGFFLPGLLQARRSSPFASATDFQESLTRISNGRAVEPGTTFPPTVVRARRSRRDLARRRDMLMGLIAAVIGGAALGVSFGGALRWLALPPAVALVAYVAMLRMDATRGRPRAARRPATARSGRPAAPAHVAAQIEAGGSVVPSVGRREAAGADTAAAAELERLAG